MLACYLNLGEKSCGLPQQGLAIALFLCALYSNTRHCCWWSADYSKHMSMGPHQATPISHLWPRCWGCGVTATEQEELRLSSMFAHRNRWVIWSAYIVPVSFCFTTILLVPGSSYAPYEVRHKRPLAWVVGAVIQSCTWDSFSSGYTGTLCSEAASGWVTG